ncbi:hypothetical protein FACS1894214_3760 [Planctomycetales bacterium]|nr:hypothetical protein FACS1894214_3760 [Planctomycetales bacterium]
MTSLYSLMQNEESVLTRLYSQSLTQLEIVRGGDTARLIEFLARKQQTVAEFEELQQQLAPHRNILPEQRKWKNENERKQTEELISRCGELLKMIVENDTASTGELSSQKDEVEKQLNRIQQNVQVNLTYAKQAAPLKPAEKVRHFDMSK